MENVSKVINFSVLVSFVTFSLFALSLAAVILVLDYLATATNAPTRDFMCPICLLDIFSINMERKIWCDVILCITIVARTQYLLMADGNVTGIAHIQKVEGIFFHESNLFHPIKGYLVVNCSTIILHFPKKISIEN